MNKDIVIFDLDGTIANIDHRKHLIEGKEKDWNAFYLACHADEPNWPVIHALRSFRFNYYKIYIFSGRSDIARLETESWLSNNGVHWDYLIMRSEGDYTADDILKIKWLNDPLVIEKERVLAVFDDRAKVVKAWRANGVPCFQVAEGDF